MTNDEVKEAARRKADRLTEAIWQYGGIAPDATWDDVSMLCQHAQDLETACIAWQKAEEASLIENPGRITDLGGGAFKKVST
jgi:hypothetical protein